MLNNEQVVTAWVMGLSARGRNIYTDGVTIWLYGPHFPIAKHLTLGRVLYNISHYSTTTAKHQSHVCGAIAWRGLEVIKCRHIDKGRNARDTRLALRILIGKIPKCRKLDDRIADVKQELHRYIKYNEALGYKNEAWVNAIAFAMSNLKGKALRKWASTEKVTLL
jgi:hypothetical protein